MGAGPILSAYTLRAPYSPTPIVDPSTGVATPQMDLWLRNIQPTLQQLSGVSAIQYGVRGNGKADDTAAIQATINQVAANGGGVALLPVGTFNIGTVTFPSGDIPITLAGQGPASIILRGKQTGAGQGLLDISGSNVTFQDFLIDGATTMPQGLHYNQDFLGVGGNDPMASSLTQNTSIWVHSNVSGFRMDRVTIQHTGGYSVLLDARSGTIELVDIVQCWFQNNRPFLFGTIGNPAIYGSWGGGILAHGAGQTAGSGVVQTLLVALCQFQRNTGNCLWSHLYGLNELHQNFRFIGNHFLDCGLDGIEFGGVDGGSASANVFRRVGYICLDDTSQSTPRWDPVAPATAIDSSGVVKAVALTGNSFTSVNGGAMDLDGHGQSAIVGNVVRVPYFGEPEYDEDQIPLTGPTNSGSASYGVNMNNTSQTAEGAANVEIVGNSFINLAGGSIRLYAARFCAAKANLIVSPDAPANPPVALGPVGPNPNQRCHDNRVAHNDVSYAPASSEPVVFEDDTISMFMSTEKNYVFGNQPITPSGSNAFEFQPSSHSGSPTYAQTVWFP